MEDFKRYLDKLKQDVKTEPKNESEKGFRAAVNLIHYHYNSSNRIKISMKEIQDRYLSGDFDKIFKEL